MPAALLDLITPSVSEPRLKRYQQEPFASPQAVIARYLWNIDLAEALYPTLNAFEVALRNNLSRQLIEDFGATWYEDERFHAILHKSTKRQLEGLLEKFHRENEQREKRGEQPKPVTSDLVVAESGLGLWASMFYRHYNEAYWLRSSRLKNVFPGASNRKRRISNIARMVRAVHELRNRAAHHEPIFNDPNLHQTHQDARALIKWLNPKVDQLLDQLDHFPQAHKRPFSEYELIVTRVAAHP